MPEPIQSSPPAPAPVTTDHEPEPALPFAPSLPDFSAVPSLSALALDCIGKIDAVLIPLAAFPPNPVAAALIGFKAGVDLRECVDEHIAKEQERAAIRECIDQGGTPIGLVDGDLTCEVER